MADDRGQLMAAAVATTAIASDVAFALFAVAGEPWGSINDIGIAISGFAIAGLTSTATDASAQSVRILSWAGAAVTAAGSALVVSRTTGWLLAGFVGSVGFGMLGPGIVAASNELSRTGRISPRLGLFGRATGLLMTLGLTATVPSAMRVDDPAKAPWWSWLTLVAPAAGLGLLPAWAIGVVRGRQRA
jgi:hypothetical protein